MNYKRLIPLFSVICICFINVYAFDVFRPDGSVTKYSMDQLRITQTVPFQTIRNKDGKVITDNWEGIPFKQWLSAKGYIDFQSIRIESYDNYMVRIHIAEFDSMPGYITLQKNGKELDSTEVRIIFPAQREMFWVRGVTGIYLENFNPAPPPDRIYVWDSVKTKLVLKHNPEPFTNASGYEFKSLMEDFFRIEEGAVILVSRDGIKLRFDYPKHLAGAILELSETDELNLMSPVIPAGMWLKDIVYIQSGPKALIRYDYLYKINLLNKMLDWDIQDTRLIMQSVKANKTQVNIESFALPETKPLSADEWYELP